MYAEVTAGCSCSLLFSFKQENQHPGLSDFSSHANQGRLPFISISCTIQREIKERNVIYIHHQEKGCYREQDNPRNKENTHTTVRKSQYPVSRVPTTLSWTKQLATLWRTFFIMPELTRTQREEPAPNPTSLWNLDWKVRMGQHLSGEPHVFCWAKVLCVQVCWNAFAKGKKMEFHSTMLLSDQTSIDWGQKMSSLSSHCPHSHS